MNEEIPVKAADVNRNEKKKVMDVLGLERVIVMLISP